MEATCGQCGEAFEAKRSTAKYCSTRCRTRATRARAQGAPGTPPVAAAAPPVQPDGDVPLLVAATIQELADAGRLGTRLGQHAVYLTTRMLSRSETGSAVGSISKELRATMEDALAGAKQDVDPLDELRTRRDRKRAG